MQRRSISHNGTVLARRRHYTRDDKRATMSAPKMANVVCAQNLFKRSRLQATVITVVQHVTSGNTSSE